MAGCHVRRECVCGGLHFNDRLHQVGAAMPGWTNV